MDKKTSLIKLNEFKADVSNVIPIDKMILFGSRAYGKPSRWSDFDLIVVSKKFSGIKSYKRARKLYDCWNLDYPVDFLCYTDEEFDRLKERMTVVKEAVKKGIEIA